MRRILDVIIGKMPLTFSSHIERPTELGNQRETSRRDLLLRLPMEGGCVGPVALVDALGNLTRFVLLPGQRHDSIAAPELIDGIDMGALLTDKGFDNNRLRELLRETENQAVIPPKADRKDTIPCDFAMYRWRHLAENFFCDLKQFRGIATRYDKTDQSFEAIILLRAIHLALK